MSDPMRCEIRGHRLYVNGEAQPVSAGAILVGLLRTGEGARFHGGIAAISRAQLRAILAAERELALAGLAGELKAA